LVACVLDPKDFPEAQIGIENHLNYFHSNGKGLPIKLARGLAAYLNSSQVDQYFRQFNDHTQVNATDLRNLRYPTREHLIRPKFARTIAWETEVWIADTPDHLIHYNGTRFLGPYDG
jgi:hypothetical protein